MRQVKLGLVQMGMVRDQQKNLDKAVEMMHIASEKGAQIVCLPELFETLYFPQDESSDIVAHPIPGPVTEKLSEAAKKNRVVLIAGSLYEKSGRKSYNTAVAFDDCGNLMGTYRKVHIPNDESFYEQNYFESGKEYQVFETKYGKIGVLICFDQWYPEPARINKLLGAEILFYPTAIGTVRGIDQTEGDWQSAWESVQRGHAIANSIVVAAVNRVGVENKINFW